jgi:hypothetical protein
MPPLTIRIISGVIALLFFTFAAVQFNDPDSFSWIFLYGYVGVMAAMAVFGKYSVSFLVPGIAIFALYFIYLIPEVIAWIGSDDSLVGSTMSADKMYIERSREAFGLLMGLGALLFLFFTRHRS